MNCSISLSCNDRHVEVVVDFCFILLHPLLSLIFSFCVLTWNFLLPSRLLSPSTSGLTSSPLFLMSSSSSFPSLWSPRLLVSSSISLFVCFDIPLLSPFSTFLPSSSSPLLSFPSSSSSLLMSLCTAASRKCLVNGNYWACPAPAQLGPSGPSTVVLERDSSGQSWRSSRRAPLTRPRPEAAGLPCFQPQTSRSGASGGAAGGECVCVCVCGLLSWLAELSVTAQ